MYGFIAEQLSTGKRLTVAIVISRSGSGPREPGAIMVLPADGDPRGTVGGGLLEAKTLAICRTSLIDRVPRLLSFDLNAPELSESGMICGGRIELLVTPLDGANSDHQRIFTKLHKALESGDRVRLIGSIIIEAATEAPVVGWGLQTAGDFDPGNLDRLFGNPGRIGKELGADKPVLMNFEGARCFILPVDPPERVFIAGAGHVGEALAEICRIAGFRTIVMDDRRAFANRTRLPGADAIRVIASYADIWSGTPDVPIPGTRDAIVIATRGHLHDKEVLAGALRTKAAYIGMIASRRKRDLIYSALMNEGFTAGDFARVHSPVGLDIGARTPAEIAVSIAAEIISVRSAGDAKTGVGKKPI